MARWLTEDEKHATLSFWHRTRDVAPDNIDVKRQFIEGGYGWPDPVMHPWCDRLNALNGVCTVSSCVGHHIALGRYSEGHIWLRLAEKVSVLLDDAVERLVEMPTVTLLTKHYFLADMLAPWEYLEIEFPGGETTLAQNIEPIIECLERVLTPE